MDEQGDEQLDFGDDEEQMPTWDEGDGEGEDVGQEDNEGQEEQEQDELAGLGECWVDAGSC
jgi:hypothetical protein